MRKTLFLLFFVSGYLGVCQITDDSTTLVYGANTTRIILESDLKNNNPKERHPDSTLYNLESYMEMDIYDHYYQDLGNNGTAMTPVFYPLPKEIGRTSGFHGYDPYIPEPATFRHYDTKSPFMSIQVVFGGEGRSVADFSYAQNINERWSIGFDIDRITSDKQIGRASQGDRNVVGTIFDVHTYYQHEKIPYSAIFQVVRMTHNVEETGGIFIEDLNAATTADLFEYQDSDIRLQDARASDKRLNWHLYHQYEWQKQLEFYHQLDIKSQTVGYQDSRDGSSFAGFDTYEGFYNQFLLGTDSTYSRMDWNEMVNEVGIKGDLANLFYRVYLKRRDIDINYLYTDPEDRFSETFLGGYTRFDWREKFNIEATGLLSQTGEYKLSGQLNSDLIFGSYTTMRSKPAFLYDSWFGNHHYWQNNFASVFNNEITAGLQLKLDWITLRPQGRLVTMDKFLYFDQDINPQQSDDIALLSSIGGEFDLTLYTNRELKQAFHFENEAYFTTITGSSADNIRIPPLFYNGRLFWRGAFFKNTMKVEVGFDMHAKTNYFAKGYAPEIQQFYLQDTFEIERFFTADAFINMQINNLRAFVKFTNVNQPTDGGYFVTPYYPGQFRVFDFGATWLFFD